VCLGKQQRTAIAQRLVWMEPFAFSVCCSCQIEHKDATCITSASALLVPLSVSSRSTSHNKLCSMLCIWKHYSHVCLWLGRMCLPFANAVTLGMPACGKLHSMKMPGLGTTPLFAEVCRRVWCQFLRLCARMYPVLETVPLSERNCAWRCVNV
jgi:hypothetical protein